jgi:nitric oxide reductase subunit B
MLMATASVFTVGVALFIWDFFRHRPRFEVSADDEGLERGGTAGRAPPPG